MENQIAITAEPTSNTLIVYCTETTKKMIDDLLADIDTDEPVGGKKVMELVVLQYLDANEMLGILTEYLKVTKRSQDEAANTGWGWWGRGGQQQQEEKTVLAGDMRLKAVESMNAISVVGRPESVADVVAKIRELDVPDAQRADEPRTIQLVNANASELADTLTQVFGGASGAGVGRTGSAAQVPTIVAVEATNQLVVRAKPSVFKLIEKMAQGLDAEMKDEPGGVRILKVEAGRNVEDLAERIEQQINDAEKNKRDINRNYKPSLVSIGADPLSNSLLVAGSKAKFEEVKKLVDELVASGPAGGRTRTVIQLKTLSPEKAKQLIEQLQQGTQGKSGGGSRPRSDASWTRDRRYERLLAPGGAASVATAGGVRRVPATVQGLMMELALASAVAQTPTTQPASAPQGPIITRIRPRSSEPAATQPAAKAGDEAGRPPATTPPARGPAGLSPEEQIKSKAPGAEINISDSALEAMQKLMQGARVEAGGQPTSGPAVQRRLSGAQVDVAAAGASTIIVEGTEADLETIQQILEMLDQAVPAKRIEYVKLKNSRAPDLAKILQDVFDKTREISKDRQPGPEDKVDIIADPRTNGIYIAAVESKMAEALKLIEQNEQDVTTDEGVLNYRFQNRRVSEAGEVLKKMIASYLKQKALPADAISVELDPQNNAVFITAGEGHLKFVEQLLKALDAEMPAEEEKPGEKGAHRNIQEADIMVVPLRVAVADKLGKVLNDLLQKAATGDTPMKDFIRRMRILDEQGEPIAQIDLNKPIAVFGDPDSNALIIASSRENCLIMREIAQVFDKEPARAEVVHKIISLQFADATEVADQIGELLTGGESLTQRPGKGEKFGEPEGPAGALVYQAVVKPDPRTNQIVLVGRPASVALLEELIGRLDVRGLEVMPFEIIKLEFASPSALETALTEMLKERADALPKGKGPNADKAETVIVKGDPRSRSLIVAAKAARMEELRGLIRKLDVPATALVEDIRTITLRKGNANDLADKLKTLWEDRQRQQEAGSKGLKLEIPAIVADERSNSLIVAAAKADFDAIKAVVDKIEGLELNPMANIYIVRLRYNSAKQMSAALSTLFEKRSKMRTIDGKTRPEDEVAIEVDEVTNSLLVAASIENYEVLMQKVAELDQEIGVPAVIEFFECSNVGAARVKETLDELFKETLFRPGGTGESKIAQDRQKVTVAVDDRSNILIVSASPENMELIREVYKRMNSTSTPWDAAITRLITIQHGDSVKIAAQVQEYFEKLDEIRSSGSAGKTTSGFKITVFADERSNRIIVGGTKDGIDSAVEMIRKLDVEPGVPGQKPVVYALHEAPAAKIGEMITKIFDDRNQPRSGATGPSVANVKVTVEADATSNTLLINASNEDHILIADLIKQLDRPSALLQMVRVFPLAKARAEKLKEMLDEVVQSSRGGGGSGGGQLITIVADPRTNAVVVMAPPGELDNFADLVRRLDQDDIRVNAEVGIFTCENEDASKMVEMLNQILSGQGQGSGGGQENEQAPPVGSMLISFQTENERGEKLLLQTIRENVHISYNERANSVVVVAPPASLKLIEQLIRKLDRIQKRSVLVKVFQLINADATKMVQLLEDMFAMGEGASDQRAFQEGREMNVEGGASSVGGVPSAFSQEGPTRKGTFGRPKTTFVADERTNSIIAAGWPEDVSVVGDIIDQLDSQPIQDRENVVISPVNMKVAEMQTALESYFQAEQQRLDRLGDSVSPQRRMEQEVSIVAHEPSNQLIVSASPRFKPQILNIIEQLDLPPPQVMIQVMIAEVTLDDRFQMGLEFALQELRFSETAVPGGNGVLQSSHFDVVGGTDLGAAGTGVAGFSFTISGEDFNFLVRALQADSRLEVIQRPMIMCQDNQQASINIGQNVPFVRGTQVNPTGQVTSQVEYEKIGIKLEIEPVINPDGFVLLHVVQEISQIADSTIDIGNGVLAPVFTERSADTWVAVKDEETVVIGGLITLQETESESKVPILGDIPGLGALFRSTSRSKTKTELLIALTPRIVRTVEDGRRMSIEARDKSGIITPKMKQNPLFERLQVLPETEDEIDWVDTPPGGLPPAEPRPAPTEEPPYGPKAPQYGPLVPAEDNSMATQQRPAA